jgi:NAD(P)H dehydrogenase (quinone)
MKISIVYHSGFGHTKVVAEHIAKGIDPNGKEVLLLKAEEATTRLDELNDADAIVFGSPTYFGTVSAEFKKFMESTGNIWYRQLWKNKLAAGFTNSSTKNGDKLNTLNSLAIFAAQHGMMWAPLGIMPAYHDDGTQAEEPNGMGSYLGYMTVSNNSHKHFEAPADLKTAELFGERIALLTRQFKGYKLINA